MRRSHFPFVVISGLPGSGKTTVARALAQSMTLPLFDKDEILERLFDSKGTGDAIWRRRLSRESDAILQAAVSSSAGAIVSSFWHAAGMPSDSGTPTGWLTGLSGTIVNVHCECPPEVAAGRFIRRTRHAGHLDEARTAADVRASIHALVPCGPLAIGEQVVVDTTKALVAVAHAGRSSCVAMCGACRPFPAPARFGRLRGRHVQLKRLSTTMEFQTATPDQAEQILRFWRESGASMRHRPGGASAASPDESSGRSGPCRRWRRDDRHAARNVRWLARQHVPARCAPELQAAGDRAAARAA